MLTHIKKIYWPVSSNPEKQSKNHTRYISGLYTYLLMSITPTLFCEWKSNYIKQKDVEMDDFLYIFHSPNFYLLHNTIFFLSVKSIISIFGS